ncbi:hypothetical protein [Nocardia sp. NPDC049149]|uniref:hypothetical protein n=1 Tax=Nocardia sp. NPDC049149 TaxID=3364315 RepID=UPI0037108D80
MTQHPSPIEPTTTHRAARHSARTRALALLAIAAVAGGTVIGAGTATATTATASNQPCLWAGTAYPPGTTIVAGGQNYRCGTDRGAPFWSRGRTDSASSTVANPGSYTNPTGLFSAGARQPGTGYNDYCVGSQLIGGHEDVYQVVTARNGAVFWKAAAPISEWAFDSGATRPGPSGRTASLCIDGNLT